MTRTGRALINGLIVVLALWGGAAAAAPAEPTPAVGDPIAARPPAPAGTASRLTLPVLGDIVAPLVLAALCGTAMAVFSAGPRQTARVRLARRRWPGRKAA
jgi:hypothetical protein